MVSVLVTELQISCLFLDLRNIKGILTNFDMDELKELFRELGLFDATLQNKYSRIVSEYAEDLIRSWIRRKDDVLKSEKYCGGPTWENLSEDMTAEHVLKD